MRRRRPQKKKAAALLKALERGPDFLSPWAEEEYRGNPVYYDGELVDACEEWPSQEEVEYCGGVCGMGSEVGGKPCTKEDAEGCEWWEREGK